MSDGKFILQNYFIDQDVYCLKVIDGTYWGFRSTASIIDWLENLAKIMQLNITQYFNINKYLTFIERGNDILSEDIKLNWKIFKQGSAFCIWTHSDFDEIIIELNTKFLNHNEIKYIYMWSSIKQILKYYVFKGVGPMHCGSANLNGKGFTIAAPGGVGKSTSIKRLPDYYKPLCDDLTLIIKKDSNYYIQPMPTWSDHLESNNFTTFNTSLAVPLYAIFFLKQSFTDKIKKLNKIESIQYINQSFIQCWESYINRLDKLERKKISNKLFENSCSLAKDMNCYLLETTLKGKFWLLIEKELEKY